MIVSEFDLNQFTHISSEDMPSSLFSLIREKQPEWQIDCVLAYPDGIYYVHGHLFDYQACGGMLFKEIDGNWHTPFKSPGTDGYLSLLSEMVHTLFSLPLPQF